MKKYLFILAGICFLLSVKAFSQSKAMHYQGVARDGAGIPLAEKVITLRASITSDSLGTVVNYSETQQVKTSPSGLFSLAIGKGKLVSGSFATINWAVQKFLKIEMSVDAKTYSLTGISQLLNVPYAMYAEKAGNAINYAAKTPLTVTDANVIGLNSGTSSGDILTWDGTNWIAKQPAIQTFNLNNMQPYLTVNYCIALQGIFPSRNGSQPYLGELMIFAGNYEPRGFAFCDGRLLPISQNTALFSILGTTYGGDGKTNFALPDLRGRVPISSGYGNNLSPRNIGENGGTERIIR